MASEPKLKGLPVATPTVLFRMIDRQLRSDPALKGAGVEWKSWEGKAGDFTPPPGVPTNPWVRITPRMGPENWWASSTQMGLLYVDVEMFVAGTCVDDILSLWWAIQRAIYPVDVTARNAFQNRLNANGAWKALIAFSPPSIANASDGHLEGQGALSLNYRFDVNPSAPGF